MSCRAWRPDELFWRAENLAEILLRHQDICGVAIFGSLARMRSEVHDIDFLALHSGPLLDGSSQDPRRLSPLSRARHRINLKDVLGSLHPDISLYRGDVPINVVFVWWEALRNCSYMRSLRKIEFSEGFFSRVFCDGPLTLLCLQGTKEGLRSYVFQGNPDQRILERRGTAPIYGLDIGHICGNIECQPKQTWEKVCELRKRH